MLVRLYTLTWVLGILTALLFYVSGNLTPIISVVFGIITIGTIFIGLIAVLPTALAHRNEHETTETPRGNQDVQRSLSVSSVDFNSRTEKIFDRGRGADRQAQVAAR